MSDHKPIFCMQEIGSTCCSVFLDPRDDDGNSVFFPTFHTEVEAALLSLQANGFCSTGADHLTSSTNQPHPLKMGVI